MQSIGNSKEAVEAFIAGGRFDDARQVAASSRSAELMARADRAREMKEAGQDASGGKAASRNDRFVLLATTEQEVHAIDAAGTFVDKLPLHIVADKGPSGGGGGGGGGGKKKSAMGGAIIGIAWHDVDIGGVMDTSQPVLAIGLQNGQFQLMRSLRDDEPVVFDVGMQTSSFCWSESAQFLLVAGQVGGNGILSLRSPLGEALQASPSPPLASVSVACPLSHSLGARQRVCCSASRSREAFPSRSPGSAAQCTSRPPPRRTSPSQR